MTTATVGPHAVSVALPPGTHPETEIPTIDTNPSAVPANNLSDFATEIGHPNQITTTHFLLGTTVSFTEGPAQYLPMVDGHQETPANLFIAIFDSNLQMWLPLRTSYDATSGRITAAVPHLSLVVDMFVSGASDVWNTAEDGVKGLADEIQKQISKTWDDYLDAPQEHSECPKSKNTAYTVTSTYSELKPCMISPKPGSNILTVENDGELAYSGVAPAGASNGGFNPADLVDDRPPFWFTRLLDWAAGRTMFAPRRVTRIGVNAALAGQTAPWFVATVPDLLAMTGSVILDLLSIIPAEKEFEVTIQKSVQVDIEVAVQNGTKLSFSSIFTTMETEAKKVNKPGFVEAIERWNKAFTCAQGVVKKAVEVRSVTDLNKLFDDAKECAEPIMEASEETAKGATSILKGVFDAIPDLIKDSKSIAQFAADNFGHTDRLSTAAVRVQFSPPWMSKHQADMFVSSTTPQECSLPPDGVPPVYGASTLPTCMYGLSVDLDGDGKKDDLIIWTRRQDGTAKGNIIDAGAAAYLADGSYSSSKETFTQWGLTNSTETSLSQPGSFDGATRVVSLATNGSQQVQFAARVGANTYAYIMFAIDSQRALRVVSDQAGATFVVYVGGGINYYSTQGCFQSSPGSSQNARYLALTNVSPGGAPGTINAPGQWGVDYFDLVGPTLYYQGRAGGVSPDYVDYQNVPDVGADCVTTPAAQLPTITPEKEGLTPVSTTTSILQDATTAGEGLDAAKSLIGGSDTDGAAATSSQFGGPQIWQNLLSWVSKNPAAWAAGSGGATVACSGEIKPSQQGGTTLVACLVKPADKTTPFRMWIEKTNTGGWVVIGVTSAGE